MSRLAQRLGAMAPKRKLGQVTPIIAPKVASKPLEIVFKTRIVEDPEDPEGEYRIEATKGPRNTFSFGFESNSTPFCCGLLEIGEFHVRGVGTMITKEEKMQAINALFETLRDNSSQGNDGSVTNMFTLVRNQECDLVRDALEHSDTHAVVKEFLNPNSGNRNTLYVSVN